MASIALRVVGTAVGFYLGNPALGYAVGAYLGSVVDPEKLPDQIGARLGAMKIEAHKP